MQWHETSYPRCFVLVPGPVETGHWAEQGRVGAVSVSGCSGTLGKRGYFWSWCAPRPRPPAWGRSLPRAGPRGLSGGARAPSSAPTRRTWRSADRGRGAGCWGDWRSAGGERMWQVPARAAAAGRPRAPVPVRLAARGRSDARTAAPRPPSERRVRREHDFCLQAGFPPGHDGWGPPASSRPNVSGAPGERGAARALSPRPRPGGRLRVAFPEPREGRGARGGSSARGSAGGGCGSAASRGLPSRRWTWGGGRVSWRAERRGDRDRGQRYASGDRGPASGNRARSGQRGAAARGGVGCARARCCHWKCRADGAVLAHLTTRCYQMKPLIWLSICKDSFPTVRRVEGEKRKKKKREGGYKALK